MTDTTIWLYTLPGVVLEGSYYHLINTNLGYFWCWDKSVFKRLLGFRSWTITQYLIPLWFWWYLTPVLSLYHLCIMVCFKYTPHTNYDIWYEVSQSVSQNCLKVPPVYLKVPRKYLKVPPLFSGTSWIWPQRKSMGIYCQLCTHIKFFLVIPYSTSPYPKMPPKQWLIPQFDCTHYLGLF